MSVLPAGVYRFRADWPLKPIVAGIKPVIVSAPSFDDVTTTFDAGPASWSRIVVMIPVPASEPKPVTTTLPSMPARVPSPIVTLLEG